eukprot:2630475-Alexandrium_andersonii.AAC.1
MAIDRRAADQIHLGQHDLLPEAEHDPRRLVPDELGLLQHARGRVLPDGRAPEHQLLGWAPRPGAHRTAPTP